MDRKAFAVYTLLIGAGMGLLANLMFYGKLIGLSFPLFISISVVVLLASSRLTGQTIRARNLWLLLPMLFFAGAVAVYADELITALNVAATLCLGGLALYYLPLKRAADQENLLNHGAGLVSAATSSLFSPFGEIGDSLAWLRERRSDNPGQRGSLLAVGRGMIIATPVLLVFAALLASADTVFAGYLDQVWNLLELTTPRDVVAQALFAGTFGWLACGVLAFGVGRRGLLADDENTPAETKRKARPMTLGIIEAGIVLGSVDILFALFVIIQFAYFFGGQANVSVNALTYAEYARRGFFELVAVSVLVLGLLLWLDWVTVRHDIKQVSIFRALAVVLVALTGVMLVSASQRMSLYESAYGYTHLRVYTHVFMFWLGVLLAVFLLALFRLREQVFSLGVLLVVIGYLVTLNLMNVEAYIADHNIDRFEAGESLDAAYLYTFSSDAVLEMLRLYEISRDDELVHEAAGQWLANQLKDLTALRANGTFFSANLSRNYARGLLAAQRNLPEANAYYRPSGSSLEGYFR